MSSVPTSRGGRDVDSSRDEPSLGRKRQGPPCCFRKTCDLTHRMGYVRRSQWTKHHSDRGAAALRLLKGSRAAAGAANGVGTRVVAAPRMSAASVTRSYAGPEQSRRAGANRKPLGACRDCRGVKDQLTRGVSCATVQGSLPTAPFSPFNGMHQVSPTAIVIPPAGSNGLCAWVC